MKVTSENIEKFEALCGDIMERCHSVGTACAFFTKDGEILYENFFGFRNLGEELPCDEDTIFGIASITKSFVTLCILNLADEGKISLDDPLSMYFPQFKGENMKGTLRLRHLLSHSGGFYPLKRTVIYDVAKKLNLSEDEEGDFSKSVKMAQEGSRIVASQMESERDFIGLPGEKMSYSNDGFGLLSEIVRLKGGENSFEDYLYKHVLEPAGMDRTSCQFIKPSLDENSSLLYRYENGELLSDHDYCFHSFVLPGAGMVKSTLRDMIKYTCIYLNGGKAADGRRIISHRLLDEMEKPRQVINPDSFYCYALSLKKFFGYNLYGHSGGLPGVSSYFAFMPELGIGGVVLCNTSSSSIGALCEAGMMMCLGYEPKVLRHDYKEITWSESFKDDLCGRYDTNEEDGFEIVRRGDSLFLKEGEKETYIKAVFPLNAIIERSFSDVFLDVLTDDEDKVYAVRLGSRVLKKINQ